MHRVARLGHTQDHSHGGVKGVANWSRIAFLLLRLPLESGGCMEKQRPGSGHGADSPSPAEAGKGEGGVEPQDQAVLSQSLGGLTMVHRKRLSERSQAEHESQGNDRGHWPTQMSHMIWEYRAPSNSPHTATHTNTPQHTYTPRSNTHHKHTHRPQIHIHHKHTHI